MQLDTEDECFNYLEQIKEEANGSLLFNSTSKGYCNGTFDGILCFPPTASNSTLTVPCPVMLGVFASGKLLSKVCLATGQWEDKMNTKKHAGYTDYSVCLNELALNEYNQKLNLEFMRALDMIELIGISISIICVLISLCIFISHQILWECQRIRVHSNLFLTILCQSLLRLGFFLDRHLFDYADVKGLQYSSLLQTYSLWACPVAMALLEYFQSCNFMWMLCEGIYLNMLITYAGHVRRLKQLVKVLYAIGWGMSALTVSIWFLAMYK